MKDTEIQISTRNVQIGMYVTRIDRPWLESPFLLQGFMINDSKDKKLLQQHCDYCYVDVHLSKVITPRFTRENNVTDKSGTFTYDIIKPTEKPPRRQHLYNDSVLMEVELKKIRHSYTIMTRVINNMLRSHKTNNNLDIKACKIAIKPIVNSIIRNPDAVFWLHRTVQQHEYSFSHALGCSLWAMTLGRQLGLPPKDLESLAIGGLLLDLGKIRIPETILNKTAPLEKSEIKSVESHVQYSLESIDTDKKVNAKIRTMVKNHHERVDGSGYPQGLVGQKIPPFAKIAAIADCYDAIIQERPYSEPLSSQEAVKKLYEWRDKDFQTELVAAFIQAIGIFPVGTLVELSTGEVAVVIAESRSHRLKPRVLLLLNADKSSRESYSICNLKLESHDAEGNPLEIKQALPVGSYNIQLEDYFLFLAGGKSVQVPSNTSAAKPIDSESVG